MLMRISTLIRHFSGVFLLWLAIAGTQQALAQTGTPTTGGPTPQAQDPTAVPLDGGASLLLASGVAYGLRKLRQRRK
jgi:hypothetical protein